jgi:hypothetical protein
LKRLAANRAYDGFYGAGTGFVLARFAAIEAVRVPSRPVIFTAALANITLPVHNVAVVGPSLIPVILTATAITKFLSCAVAPDPLKYASAMQANAIAWLLRLLWPLFFPLLVGLVLAPLAAVLSRLSHMGFFAEFFPAIGTYLLFHAFYFITQTPASAMCAGV